MSSSSSEETEMLLRSKATSWDSIESTFNQKISNLTKSDSWFNIYSQFSANINFSEMQFRETQIKNFAMKPLQWELIEDKNRFPQIIQTRSLLQDELEILKINMSMNDSMVPLRHSQMLNCRKMEARRMKRKKFKKCIRRPVSCFHVNKLSKAKDLVNEIEKSEAAKTDKTAWKFLKRGSSFRKDYINSRKLALEIRAVQTPGFELQSDSRFQNIQPVKITCPNCLFFITTIVKKVKSVRFKFISVILAAVGCIFPDVFYVFKDTVHLCPLCKIYLGFCPTFYVRANQEKIKSTQLNILEYSETKIKPIREKKTKGKKTLEEMKMVSASSTSAKNLFVESKLRLSDRVQVNVNNIAAIARQIQRGSKSNENLMTAAKNFALQEAAIENSETNLKKLKLLTTHINNQLDSLHNSAMKMEVVLEQVRSMQR